VALIHGEDRRKNVHDALVAIDGQVRPKLQRKKYVIIKPNGVAAHNPFSCTSADALRGVLDYLAPRFKGPVVIAESSAEDTLEAYESCQYNRLLSEYGKAKLSLVDLNRTPGGAASRSGRLRDLRGGDEDAQHGGGNPVREKHGARRALAQCSR
jgi:uncharacterized protein (DUF362 family)